MSLCRVDVVSFYLDSVETWCHHHAYPTDRGCCDTQGTFVWATWIVPKRMWHALMYVLKRVPYVQSSQYNHPNTNSLLRQGHKRDLTRSLSNRQWAIQHWQFIISTFLRHSFEFPSIIIIINTYVLTQVSCTRCCKYLLSELVFDTKNLLQHLCENAQQLSVAHRQGHFIQ